MILDLNTELVEKSYRSYKDDRPFDIFSRDANQYDWKNRQTIFTEIAVKNIEVPDNCIRHSNYLGYLSRCYADHYSVVLNPEHFWYTVVCEIAQLVTNNPETYRDLFTKKPDKIDIVVDCASEDDPLRMDDIVRQMHQHVPLDINLFCPDINMPEVARLAILAAFLETASPYYNYMMFACGIPRIKIGGTVADWQILYLNLNELKGQFTKYNAALEDWFQQCEMICGGIINTLANGLESTGEGWWSQIIKNEHCGSGGEQLLTGWWTRLFINYPSLAKIENFSSHITKVPYTTHPSGTKWHLTFLLSHSIKDDEGFMVPQFSYAQVKHLEEPVIQEDRLIKEYTLISTANNIIGKF